MDERLRSIVGDLRRKDSGDAANWLMEHYPVTTDHWGEAIMIIPHLSWKRGDQTRLAEYYLSRLPFASGRVYEAFASFMKVSRLIDVMRKYLPTDDRKQLLEYHAAPVLTRAAKTAEDHEAVQSFLTELKAKPFREHNT
jgi:hypothetical protein